MERPRHRQHLASSRYKTVSSSFRSSVLRSFLSAAEYDVERRKDGVKEEASTKGEKEEEEEREGRGSSASTMKKRLWAYYWFRELRLASRESSSEAVVAARRGNEFKKRGQLPL